MESSKCEGLMNPTYLEFVRYRDEKRIPNISWQDWKKMPKERREGILKGTGESSRVA